MINVLSIDGGGIRGFIPALVLQHIEIETGRPTAEHFDLIAGTSTGGILALGLTLPQNGTASDPRYSAEELAALYRDRGEDIFHQPRWRQVASVVNLFDEKYDHSGLEGVLDEYFGDQPVGDGLTDVMVSSYDIQAREPYFFMSWREPDQTVPMRRAARATSAAPTYFEPAKVAVGDQQRVLVDGGVFVNNPAVSAYAEAERRYPDEPIRLVSIGTGSATEPIGYDESQEWGKLGWAVETIDIVFDGVSDAADYQLRHVLGDRFDRFQVPLESASDAMDDASIENLEALAQDAERMMATQADALEALCNRLDEA
ncbi:patatin [Salinibacter sp. 10B]|uniref:patatin-like phospholipase family protein n=1 Tax=Salinibacter sp. 10B TaxID=1923971 RepID=UPI000CF3E9B7|nr:patatin-like phospholipase family protein [Salinibacter sp. 10B]PQJ34998.1 patatin [Salinibacter sp. 10B]